MWLANFEDGKTISSKHTFWTQLKEKADGAMMTGLQLTSAASPNLDLCLSGLDRYYFVTEAITMLTDAQSHVVAEIIGGHNLELGVGVEIRLEYTGSVKTRIYPVEKFKYAKEILVDGSKEH